MPSSFKVLIPVCLAFLQISVLGAFSSTKVVVAVLAFEITDVPVVGSKETYIVLVNSAAVTGKPFIA